MKQLSETVALGLVLLGLGMIVGHCVGCGLDAKTVAKDALSVTQIACVFASALTDDAAVAEACKIDKALTPLLRDLIGQREGAKRAGVSWDAGADAH